jgi:hypothetical protein
MDKWWPFCQHGNELLTLSKKGDMCDLLGNYYLSSRTLLHAAGQHTTLLEHVKQDFALSSQSTGHTVGTCQAGLCSVQSVNTPHCWNMSSRTSLCTVSQQDTLLEHVKQDFALYSQSTGHTVGMSVANLFHLYSTLACVRSHSSKDVGGYSVEWMTDSAHWMSQSGCWDLCFVIMRSRFHSQLGDCQSTLRFPWFSSISPGKWCVWNQAITTSYHSILNYAECLHICTCVLEQPAPWRALGTEQTLTKLRLTHKLQENANDYC